MSVIEVKCMQCGKSFKFKAESAGKKVKCDVCSKIITIPDPVKRAEAVMDVNVDVADSERRKAAHSLALGPAGLMRKPERGFFARLFGKK